MWKNQPLMIHNSRASQFSAVHRADCSRICSTVSVLLKVGGQGSAVWHTGTFRRQALMQVPGNTVRDCWTMSLEELFMMTLRGRWNASETLTAQVASLVLLRLNNTSSNTEPRGWSCHMVVQFARISFHLRRKPTLEVAQVLMQVFSNVWMREKVSRVVTACRVEAEKTVVCAETVFKLFEGGRDNANAIFG